MTRPYQYRDYRVTYDAPVDECALLVRLSQRRAGISMVSGQPRAIYGKRATPLADHVLLSLVEDRKERHASVS